MLCTCSFWNCSLFLTIKYDFVHRRWHLKCLSQKNEAHCLLYFFFFCRVPLLIPAAVLILVSVSTGALLVFWKWSHCLTASFICYGCSGCPVDIAIWIHCRQRDQWTLLCWNFDRTRELRQKIGVLEKILFWWHLLFMPCMDWWHLHIFLNVLCRFKQSICYEVGSWTFGVFLICNGIWCFFGLIELVPSR